MTRRPTDAPRRSALYAALLARTETEAQHSMPLPGNAARLDALRAGRPVDVSAGDLPEWARVGEPTDWWRRAIVTVTGTVEFYDDTGRRWLEEEGL